MELFSRRRGSMAEHYDTKVLIIGSGPAGYAAAIYASRANLKPVMVSGLDKGGQLTITTDVENYPGFAEAVQGPWLMEQMQAQAEHVGTTIVEFDLITEIDLSRRPFQAKSDGGRTFSAETVIIATGAQARWLGLESEQKFQGGGVSACATCDGFFFRGKEVAVIGGGNTAVEEALYLSNIVGKVWLVHRRDELRSEKILQNRLFARPNIEAVWDTVLEEILGQDMPPAVTAVSLRNVKTGETRELPVDGVFVAIGHSPASGIFRGQVDMDEGGYIVTKPDSTETSIPGVFAAGDVKDKVYRQAVTAAGMGCMAALDAERFIAGIEHEKSAAAE